MLTRRTFTAAAAALLVSPTLLRAERNAAGITLGFSTYGMKSLTAEKAIGTIADIGFDAVELAVRPDFGASPAHMSQERRTIVRDLLANRSLILSSLMEHLPPERDDAKHQASLDRLRKVAELGTDLSPNSQPLIQTVLGGGEWDDVKTMLVDRVGDWAKLAKETKTVIAIKPHRGGGMSTPHEAAWIIQQLDNTPWIRMVYDYSHYAFRDMPVDDTIKTALPITAHIAVKDTVKTEAGFRFVLPGDSGKFDYAHLVSKFHTGGYRGDISCEVSGQVWSKPGYDPVQSAKTCYANLAPAFAKAGVDRKH